MENKAFEPLIHLKLNCNHLCVIFILSLQLGTMISTEPTVLEACGGLIPDPADLKTLLLHQQAKGLLGVKGIVQT